MKANETKSTWQLPLENLSLKRERRRIRKNTQTNTKSSNGQVKKLFVSSRLAKTHYQLMLNPFELLLANNDVTCV